MQGNLVPGATVGHTAYILLLYLFGKESCELNRNINQNDIGNSILFLYVVSFEHPLIFQFPMLFRTRGPLI